MRTNKGSFLLIMLIWMGSSVMCLAQTKPVALTVIYAEGEISYRPSAKAAWIPLTAGKQAVEMPSNCQVKLTSRALLVMGKRHNSPVIVRGRTGVFELATLFRLPTATDEVTDVLGQYFAYLWRNLTHNHETIDSYAQGYMKRKGVVSRGDGCVTSLMTSPDYGAVLSSDTALTFVWHRDTSAMRYTLALYDAPGEKASVLYSTETTDTTIRLTPDKQLLHKNTTYYWAAFPVGKVSCSRYLFSIPEPEKIRELDAKIDRIQQQISGDPALRAFTKAALYEQNKYYAQAYKNYLAAYRLSPDNTLYREGFALFLARRGMVSQAKDLYLSK